MGMLPQLQVNLGSFNLHCISGRSQTMTNSTAYCLREPEIFTDLMEPNWAIMEGEGG